MPTPRSLTSRLKPYIRPPRPQDSQPAPRRFTQSSRLLLYSHSHVRPQLPFLSPTSGRLASRQHPGHWHLNRLLTTETRAYIKEQAQLTLKYTAYGWAIIALGLIASYGWTNSRIERTFPAPDEWSWFSKFTLRAAKAEEDQDFHPATNTNWARAGKQYKVLLERLEDPNKDGKGLVEQGEGGILIPGVGKGGYDLTGKSEEWRQGYFDALMGCAKAAEMLDGLVKDKNTNQAYPKEFVVGPSNPEPRPMPPTAGVQPLEENCVPVYEPPETFYMRALTSKGLTTEQRLTAALGYAEWLDFKNQPDAAGEMFKWAVDIASSGVPDSSAIIDKSTGVISGSAPYVTPNILKAATALATHKAQTSDISSALPIYLSVLRARRSAPQGPEIDRRERPQSPVETAINFFTLARYPPLSKAGDDPLQRTSEEFCDEAAVMTYIGEIMFANSRKRQDREAGLNFTREAVQMALQGMHNQQHTADLRKKCAKCAEVALENWLTMAKTLLAEKSTEGAPEKKSGSWLGGWWASSNEDADGNAHENDAERWSNEIREVENKLRKVRVEASSTLFSNSRGSGRFSII